MGQEIVSDLQEIAFNNIGYPGVSGKFSGSADYISIPAAALNDLNDLSEYTIESWVKFSNIQQGTLIAKQYDFTNTWGVLSVGYPANPTSSITNTQGKLYFHGHDGVQVAESKTLLQKDAWYHLAIVANTTQCLIYINGVKDTPTLGDYSIANNTKPKIQTAIGAWLGDGGGKYLQGEMYSISVWSKALSATAIMESMLQPVTGSEPNLVCCFLPGSVQDGKVIDISPNQYIGTVTGSIGPVEDVPPFGLGERVIGNTFPIGMKVYNDYHNTDLPVLYIVSEADISNPEQNLHIHIENVSQQTIELKKISLPENEGPGPSAFHLAFRWRKGTFSTHSLQTTFTKANLEKSLGGNWLASDPVPSASDDSMAVFFINNTGVTFAPGFTEKIVLEGVSAAPGAGSRGTRVQIDYANMCYQGQTKALSGTRTQFLDIVNHRGKANIPLHVGFVGSNTVLNDGSSNQRVFRITNPSQESTITLQAKKDHQEASSFTINFDANDDYGLANKDDLDGITIQGPKTGTSWKTEPETEGENLIWPLTPDENIPLGPGQTIDFIIDDIISQAKDGLCNLYCHYANIPGYWDGTIVVPMIKGPLTFRGQNVGIGTDDPAKKLDVIGDVGVTGAVAVTGDADVTGDMKINGKLGVKEGEVPAVNKDATLQVWGQIWDDTGPIMPKGAIIMWSGTVDAIPSGWKLCDKTNHKSNNNIPDLSDRFILGAGNNYNPKNATGGSDTITLTTDNMPSHNHGVTDPGHIHCLNNAFNHGSVIPEASRQGNWQVGGTKDTGPNTNSAKTGITSTEHAGDGKSFSILPPYYALCFIMKT